MTNRVDRVRTAILRHALHAQPVTLESLAAEMRTSPEDIKAALAALTRLELRKRGSWVLFADLGLAGICKMARARPVHRAESLDLLGGRGRGRTRDLLGVSRRSSFTPFHGSPQTAIVFTAAGSPSPGFTMALPSLSRPSE